MNSISISIGDKMKFISNFLKWRAERIAKRQEEQKRLLDERLVNKQVIEKIYAAGPKGLLVRYNGKTAFALSAVGSGKYIGLYSRIDGKLSHFEKSHTILYFADLDEEGYHLSLHHPVSFDFRKYPVGVQPHEDEEEAKDIENLYHEVLAIGEKKPFYLGPKTGRGITLRDHISNCGVLSSGKGELIIERVGGKRVWLPYHAVKSFRFDAYERAEYVSIPEVTA